MKVKRKEIVIEIERIKVVKKPPVTPNATETKENKSAEFSAGASVKSSSRLESLFSRYFLRRI